MNVFNRWLSSSGGIVDAGLSALATFLVGLQSVRTLNSEQLALFSLLFSGTLIAMLLPQQLVYLAARIQVLALDGRYISPIMKDLVRGVPVSACAVIVVLLAASPLLIEGKPLGGVDLGLTVGAALFVVLSPFQDHLRASLHMIGRHWAAAALSLVVLMIVLGALSLAARLDLEGIGLFGSLALGNAVSILFGVVMLRRTPRSGVLQLPQFRVRVRYLGSDLTTQLSWYLASLIVILILGSAALAELEAARIVAAPVFVLVSGLSAAIVPSLVRAVIQRSESLVSRTRRLLAAVLGTGFAYSLATLILTPLIGLITGREIMSGLALGRAVASTIEGTGNSLSSALYARNQSGNWILANACGAGLSLVLLAILLPVLNVMAFPLAIAVGMLFRLLVGLRLLFSGGGKDME